jgi:alpha-amylase/alpha-mannosidase (GH57 family)
MPRQRFVHPEDAALQLTKAVECHERLFGRRPVGLWPSEGSVSDAIVPLAAAAGFRWMATDELILARTLGVTFSRDGQGQVEQPDRLYLPYQLKTGGAQVACAFRDHTLSDLIGFTYAGWDAEHAADDFVGRLAEAGRRYRERTGGGVALIPIILDGENAWEHFEGGGRPFLRALYGRLARHPELRTVTLGEACAGATEELTGIFPGSWIDANFYIWIGHADDQRAWSQLAEACAALEEPAVDAGALAQAREEVLIAEGSDWFWWYGDDHSSAHDLEFDDLFRRHLRNAYRLLQKPVPEELYVSNISTGVAAPLQTAPTAYLRPVLDGEETSYFEWLGAGTLEVVQTAGAMHQIDRPHFLLRQVHFGFDREQLFIRIDATRRVTELLAEGHVLSLKFMQPTGLHLSVRLSAGQLTTAWDGPGPGRPRVAAGTVLELALPLAELSRQGTETIAFFVALTDVAGVEIERHPPFRPIETVMPDAQFEARNWTA